MDQLKSNSSLQKWWDCIKQLAGYPKRRAISIVNDIVNGDALANKINNFFTAITNKITLLLPEPSESQNLTNATSNLNLLSMKKACLTNCLIFLF